MGKLKQLYLDGVTDLVSFHAGVEVERERIIKLIETHTKIYHKTEKISCSACKHKGYGDDWEKHIVALIKGENR